MIEDKDMIEDKIRLFFSKSLPIHISKKNGEWLNGSIIEVGSNFLLLKEFKLNDMLVFFSEIAEVEQFREVKE